MEKLNINSFKNLIDKSKFEKIKVKDTTYLNVNSIMPISNIKKTLQNRIFIMIIMFINGGIINNPYNKSSTTSKFDSLELDKLPNDVFLINYKHFNTTTYSNIVCNIVYLIMNYINIDLLESEYNLTPRGQTMEFPDIFSFSSNIINDVLNDNYSNFTTLMNEISSDTAFKRTQMLEIGVVEKFINKLFLNISDFIIEKLNSNPTSTYNIDKSKIQTLFNKDFEGFSEFRDDFFKPCKDIFSTILQDNDLSKPMYNFVTSYFDEENKREDNKYLRDDVSSFNKMELFLSKNITELDKQQGNESKINSDRLLIIVGNITNNLIYKLSDLTPLLLNLSQICENNNSSELNFNNMYSSELKGGAVAPIIVMGLKGAVEIVAVGQNIPGLGIVHAVVTNAAGEIISASLTSWAGSSAGAVASQVLTYTAATATTVVTTPFLLAGAAAAVVIGGLAYYYYGNVNAGINIATPQATGINIATPQATEVKDTQQTADQQTADQQTADQQTADQQTADFITEQAADKANAERGDVLKAEDKVVREERTEEFRAQQQARAENAVREQGLKADDQAERAQRTGEFRAQQQARAANVVNEANLKAEDKVERAQRTGEFRAQQQARAANVVNEANLKAQDKVERAERVGEFRAQQQARADNVVNEANLKAQDKVERAERVGEFRAQQQAREANVVNEANLKAEDQAARAFLKADFRLKQQGPLMLGAPGKDFDKYANGIGGYDAQDIFGGVTTSLTLVNFGVKLWRWKNGYPSDDPNPEVEKIVQKMNKDREAFDELSKRMYGDPDNPLDFLNRPYVNSSDTPEWQNLATGEIPLSTDFSIPLSTNIWPEYNMGTPLPSYMSQSYGSDVITPNIYAGYDMGAAPNLSTSFYNMGTTPNLTDYSHLDMGGIQIQQEDDYDDVPELVPSEDYIRELLEQEDEAVKELSKKYKINNKKDIEKIKELIKTQNRIEQFEYKGETIQYKSKENPKEKLVSREYTPIGPTRQFQDGTTGTGQSNSSGSGVYSTVTKLARLAASAAAGIKFGGAIDEDLLQQTLSILNEFIVLQVFNGEMFFLIPENINPQIIQKISMLNSISFLENYKNLQLLNNNKLSYENINSYLSNCNSELDNFINLKGGKKIVLVKTKKYKKKLYLKTNKHKNIKKANKKTKKYKKNIKKIHQKTYKRKNVKKLIKK
jgi:hypothetical protein